MKQYKAVIFDMDGTLFDTEKVSRLAWYKVGKRHHLPVNDQFILDLIGLTPSNAQRIYDQYMPKNWPQKEALKSHQEFFTSYRNEAGMPPKGDLHKLLSNIKTRGYQIALATSARQDNMEANLKMADIAKYFDVTISAEHMEYGKPHPDIYHKTMQALGRKPDECIIVEDSYNGVRSAYASKASVIMIPDMLEPTKEMEAMCDYILHDLEEILTIL